MFWRPSRSRERTEPFRLSTTEGVENLVPKMVLRCKVGGGAWRFQLEDHRWPENKQATGKMVARRLVSSSIFFPLLPVHVQLFLRGEQREVWCLYFLTEAGYFFRERLVVVLQSCFHESPSLFPVPELCIRRSIIGWAQRSHNWPQFRWDVFVTSVYALPMRRRREFLQKWLERLLQLLSWFREVSCSRVLFLFQFTDHNINCFRCAVNAKKALKHQITAAAR